MFEVSVEVVGEVLDLLEHLRRGTLGGEGLQPSVRVIVSVIAGCDVVSEGFGRKTKALEVIAALPNLFLVDPSNRACGAIDEAGRVVAVVNFEGRSIHGRWILNRLEL